MEAWGWIIVYLVGFTLFQLLLFRYFTDDGAFSRLSFGSGETSAPGSAESGRSTTEGPRTGIDRETDEGEADGIVCRHCGTVNEQDQMITYCQNCLEQL